MSGWRVASGGRSGFASILTSANSGSSTHSTGSSPRRETKLADANKSDGKAGEAHNRTVAGKGVKVGFGGGEVAAGGWVAGSGSSLGPRVSDVVEQPARNSSAIEMEAVCVSFTV